MTDTGLTWQEAKAQTQATEMDIADQIPRDVVLSKDQQEKGGLLSCGPDRHRWKGATIVTVISGTDIESLVKDLADHYAQETEYEISTRRNILDQFELQLVVPDASENYIVAEFNTDSIRIPSSSSCFTLPEGVYPGGDF